MPLGPIPDAFTRFNLINMPQRKSTNIRNVRPAAQKKGNHKSRSKSSSNLVPRQPFRSGKSQIQELWTPLYPASIRRRLRYSTNITLTATSGIPAAYLFATNGLFDPDVTGVGHQPMGFDQIMLSYNHYCVFNSRIVATFKNTSANSPTVAIRLDANNSALTDITQIIEYGALQMEPLEAKNSYGANITLSSSVNIRKIQGSRFIQDDPDLRGGLSSNPVELTYFHIMLWDATSATSTCAVDIQMEFDALFAEPRDLSTSLSSRDLRNFLLSVEKKTVPVCDTGKFPTTRTLSQPGATGIAQNRERQRA